jgi:hypothetical protein
MKTKIVVLLLFMPILIFGQSSTRVFSFSPVPTSVENVNGVAFGIGHMFDKRERTITINGLNLEINPLTPFVLAIQDPSRMSNKSVALISNGVHLSIGGFSGDAVQNGLGISIYNVTVANNGVSITGVYNVSNSLNGLHISGLSNGTKTGAGALIAPFNVADEFTGLQLGLYNQADKMTGLQIGLFNESKSRRGLQIGLWNVNGKRSLPFINF